jgi:2-polyprenyl-3-methyl-5-hydroxy-6-metoxy-1,4-benzoquinol methylase
MLTLRAVVTRHPRLQFKDAAATVEAFVDSRLKSASFAEVRFAADRQAGRNAVEAMARQSADGYIVLADVMNPMTDRELVGAMVECLQRNESDVCLCDGAIPGTQVELVVDAARVKRIPGELDGSGLRIVRKRWSSQERHNNQFNLYKYKRLKLFLRLVQRLEGMHAMTIDEFVATLERDDIFAMLAAFGEEARLVWHHACPHCGGRLVPLPMKMSQPLCGYLPSNRALYHECERCTLGVASPVVHEDDVARVYDEFDKQDFVASLNNPYNGESPRCDFSAFEKDLPQRARMIDLGGGIGRFSQFVKARHPAWSVTHADFAIKRNEHLTAQGIETRALDFLKEPIGKASYDLVTAWEVIEHVPYGRIAGFLDNVHEALTPGGYFVFSTPNFDSPLCKSFDFYAICPPFHYLIFGERWLRHYFSDSTKWRYCEPRACSDFLDDAVMWFDYGATTCPSVQLRGLSSVLENIFRLDQSKALRRGLLQQGIGTEVIVTLQKRR